MTKEKDEPMSSTEGGKLKPDNYEYSWFLPAGGNSGSVIVAQGPPSEHGADPAQGEDSELKAMQARTEKWRHSGENGHQTGAPTLRHIDTMRLRLAGIAGWSAMAAVGGLVLSMRAGAFPGTQLGILGGVWVGVTALIWFIPKKL